MTVGCLGDIPFEVSDDTILLLSNFKWQGKANYTTHKRVGGNALVEFTGLDADQISFKLTLSAALGVTPMDVLVKLWEYERGHKQLPLVLGGKIYGKYRWVIQSHNVVGKVLDGAGRIHSAEVTVQLLEYLLE